MADSDRHSNAASHRNNLFSTLISDIKSYSGKDPLLPWLRGIKTLKESLLPELLKEKLPRFLQKCTQTFESDRRYKNDARYLRVWVELMDYVDDPSVLLRTMEANRIGTTRSLFYQAYALYYEKIKKFEEADKMYHLGVQNLAEPVNDLKKSYDQFLCRMEKYKHKKEKHQERKFPKQPISCRIPQEDGIRDENRPQGVGCQSSCSDSMVGNRNKQVNEPGVVCKDKLLRKENHGQAIRRDDSIVSSFVDTAIVGKRELEDARHHGLVEPTINMKEALNDINSMFSEPIDIDPPRKGLQRAQAKENLKSNNGFTVFVDENVEKHHFGENSSVLNQRPQTNHILQQEQPFEIYMDDEDNDGAAFVFTCPKDDVSPESCDRPNAQRSFRGKFREDTVVRKFVGSAISDEPVVENACHHGLVDPTINLKEAMEDINNMFGEPIEFVRRKRSKIPERVPEEKQTCMGFSILPDSDDDDDDSGSHSFEQVPQKHPTNTTGTSNGGFSIFVDDEVKLLPTGKCVQQKSSGKKVKESDLFEPTVFTKEALDDINQLFSMPI